MSGRRKSVRITVSGHITLSKGQVWPDGDAPRSPTAEDVCRSMHESIGSRDVEPPQGYQLLEVLREWNLGDSLRMTVVVDGEDKS